MSDEGATPLACVVGAIPAGERAAHAEVTEHLFRRAVRERRELDHGYAFRFDAEELHAITRFIANERLCCPFLTFAAEVQPAGGSIWLTLRGPAGTRGFLETELPL